MPDLQATTFGKEKFFYLSPEKSHQLAFTLASSINQKITKAELEKPEIVIGIARGALTWIKTLADWLNIDQTAIIRMVHYAEVGKTLSQPRILESFLPQIDRKRVLLFDNVVETGKTMRLACDYLKMRGVAKITTAVLFYKKSSVFVPDFYSSRESSWIIFHFDIVETVKCLGSRWLNQGLDLTQIKKRFLTIGLPVLEVNEALKIIFNFYG